MLRVFQLLVVFLLTGSTAFGQSNLVQRMTNVHLQALGVTLGYLETNLYGTLRFSTNSGLQIYLPPGVWQGLSTGSVTECGAPANPGGTGNVSLSNAWRTIYSDGDTNVVELALGADGSALVSTGPASAPAWRYIPGPTTSFVYGIDYRPQQYVTYLGGTYYAISAIVATQYAPHTTNAFPVPTTHPASWGVVAGPGEDGASVTGPQGTPGADGVGDILYYGAWRNDVTYDTATTSWVRYDGQLYEALSSSINKNPELNTSYWGVVVAKSASGILWPSNGVVRGAFDAGSQYYTNDFVTYSGSSWMVTNQPPLGTFPPTTKTGKSSYWLLWVGEGDVGSAGPRGPPGEDSVVQNIIQYTVYQAGTNVFVDDNFNVVSNVFKFTHTADGTNFFTWAPSDWALARTGYYTKIEADARFASSGSITNETDPVWESEKSNYATGTPVYVEADTAWHGGTGALWAAINAAGGGITGVTIAEGESTGATTNDGHVSLTYVPGSGDPCVYDVFAVPFSATITINPSNGPVQGLIITNNCTIAAWAHPDVSESAALTTLYVVHSTGSVTWDTNTLTLSAAFGFDVSATNALLLEYRWNVANPVLHKVGQ